MHFDRATERGAHEKREMVQKASHRSSSSSSLNLLPHFYSFFHMLIPTYVSLPLFPPPTFFPSHLLPPFFSLSFSSPISSIFSSLIIQKHLFRPTCLCSLLHSRGRLFCLHLLLTPLLLLPSVLPLLQLDTQVSQNMHTHTHSCIICKPSDLL